MRAGDLVSVTMTVPSMFEPLHGEPTKLLKFGDLVILIKHAPTGWHTPCWHVLYDGQVGVVCSRWLKAIKSSEQ